MREPRRFDAGLATPRLELVPRRKAQEPSSSPWLRIGGRGSRSRRCPQTILMVRSAAAEVRRRRDGIRPEEVVGRRYRPSQIAAARGQVRMQPMTRQLYTCRQRSTSQPESWRFRRSAHGKPTSKRLKPPLRTPILRRLMVYLGKRWQGTVVAAGSIIDCGVVRRSHRQHAEILSVTTGETYNRRSQPKIAFVNWR